MRSKLQHPGFSFDWNSNLARSLCFFLSKSLEKRAKKRDEVSLAEIGTLPGWYSCRKEKESVPNLGGRKQKGQNPLRYRHKKTAQLVAARVKARLQFFQQIDPGEIIAFTIRVDAVMDTGAGI